jgi:hypothetical protein
MAFPGGFLSEQAVPHLSQHTQIDPVRPDRRRQLRLVGVYRHWATLGWTIDDAQLRTIFRMWAPPEISQYSSGSFDT